MICAPTFAYASTLPVQTMNYSHMVEYTYVDGPMVILPNNDETLFHYYGGLGGSFAIPANRLPSFSIGCYSQSNYLLQVYMMDPIYTLIYQTVVTNSSSIVLPSVAYERTIVVKIRPIGSDALLLYAYNYSYK